MFAYTQSGISYAKLRLHELVLFVLFFGPPLFKARHCTLSSQDLFDACASQGRCILLGNCKAILLVEILILFGWFCLPGTEAPAFFASCLCNFSKGLAIPRFSCELQRAVPIAVSALNPLLTFPILKSLWLFGVRSPHLSTDLSAPRLKVTRCVRCQILNKSTGSQQSHPPTHSQWQHSHLPPALS